MPDALRPGAVRTVVEFTHPPGHAALGGEDSGVLRYFTLDGSDYPSHAAQEAAIAGYVRWANRRARPKQQYAIGSKIRRPDYLPNVA